MLGTGRALPERQPLDQIDPAADGSEEEDHCARQEHPRARLVQAVVFEVLGLRIVVPGPLLEQEMGIDVVAEGGRQYPLDPEPPRDIRHVEEMVAHGLGVAALPLELVEQLAVGEDRYRAAPRPGAGRS